jgi:hypothetical protein
MAQPDLDEEMQADPIKWTIRKKLAAALLRPAELKLRQPEWTDEEMADAATEGG